MSGAMDSSFSSKTSSSSLLEYNKPKQFNESGFIESRSNLSIASTTTFDAEERILSIQQQVSLLKRQQQEFAEEAKRRERQHIELVRKLRDDYMNDNGSKLNDTRPENQEETLKAALQSYEIERNNLSQAIEFTDEDTIRHIEIAEKVKDTLVKQLQFSEDEYEILQKQLAEREAFLEKEKERIKVQVESSKERIEKLKETKTTRNGISLSELDPRTEKEILSARSEVTSLVSTLDELKKQTTNQITAMNREVENLKQQLVDEESEIKLRQKAKVDLPPGFILWFHANAYPRIFALSQEENVEVLLEASDSAPNVYPELPDGIAVKVNPESKTVALQANESLEDQLQRVTENGQLTEHEFWLHYFSHAHGIKSYLAEQAWIINEDAQAKNANVTLTTFINLLSQGLFVTKIKSRTQSKNVRLFLKQVERMSKHKHVPEMTYTLNWFATTSDDTWYKSPQFDEGALATKKVRSINLNTVKELKRGKTKKFPDASVPDLCFSIISTRKTLMFETRTHYECEALVEGFRLILSEIGSHQSTKKRFFGLLN